MYDPVREREVERVGGRERELERKRERDGRGRGVGRERERIDGEKILS